MFIAALPAGDVHAQSGVVVSGSVVVAGSPVGSYRIVVEAPGFASEAFNSFGFRRRIDGFGFDAIYEKL